MPLSLPNPLSAGGMLVGSAGRATGRVEGPAGAIGLGAGAGLVAGAAVARGVGAALGGVEGRLATAFGFGAIRVLGAARLAVARLAVARFARVLPARVAVDERRLLLARFVPVDLTLVRLADDRLASVLPAFLAVIRLAEEVGFLAVERLAVDFFDEDFFFAGISPPSVRERLLAYGFSAELWHPTVFPACYSIGLAQRQALAHSAEAEP